MQGGKWLELNRKCKNQKHRRGNITVSYAKRLLVDARRHGNSKIELGVAIVVKPGG